MTKKNVILNNLTFICTQYIHLRKVQPVRYIIIWITIYSCTPLKIDSSNIKREITYLLLVNLRNVWKNTKNKLTLTPIIIPFIRKIRFGNKRMRFCNNKSTSNINIRYFDNYSLTSRVDIHWKWLNQSCTEF